MCLLSDSPVGDDNDDDDDDETLLQRKMGSKLFIYFIFTTPTLTKYAVRIEISDDNEK